MKLSKFATKVRDQKIKTARTLYKEGLSTRSIAPIVKRSHTWVAQQVKGLSTETLHNFTEGV